MSMFIALLAIAAGVWLIGYAVLTERSPTADINEVGLALAMGIMGFIVAAAALLFLLFKIYVNATAF